MAGNSNETHEQYDLSKILGMLEEMQRGTAEDGTTVDVILAPHDEPGHARFEVTADEGASTPEFLLDLRDTVESALKNGEYEGRVTRNGGSTVFIEDVAEDLFSDFDRSDRK